MQEEEKKVSATPHAFFFFPLNTHTHFFFQPPHTSPTQMEEDLQEVEKHIFEFLPRSGDIEARCCSIEERLGMLSNSQRSQKERIAAFKSKFYEMFPEYKGDKSADTVRDQEGSEATNAKRQRTGGDADASAATALAQAQAKAKVKAEEASQQETIARQCQELAEKNQTIQSLQQTIQSQQQMMTELFQARQAAVAAAWQEAKEAAQAASEAAAAAAQEQDDAVEKKVDMITSITRQNGLLVDEAGVQKLVSGPFNGARLRTLLNCDYFQMMPFTKEPHAGKYEMWFDEDGKSRHNINDVATKMFKPQLIEGDNLCGNVLVLQPDVVL